MQVFLLIIVIFNLGVVYFYILGEKVFFFPLGVRLKVDKF